MQITGENVIFHDKLRSIFLMNICFIREKDNLENEILQLKLEKEQKIRRYSHIRKKDVRKYFSH